ncbi:MAG: hypothetical protein OXI22_12545 [Defluviicoccus sp.]|nr:hypothetical protein [Defluviicoccus sp.]MDE0384708.1 hypothetical protein [Defluviicoccus sp.]
MATTLLCLAALLAGTASAHVASRAQWHPLAAAYLDAVFASRIDPVDWQGIARRYESTDPAFRHAGPVPAFVALARLSSFAGTDPGAAIRRAIAARDASALRKAAARANAFALRAGLDRVRRLLERPGEARAELRSARLLWRGFEAGLRARDPAAHKRLGLAWLSLATLLSGETGRAEAERLIGELASEIRARFEDAAPPLPPAAVLPPGGALVEQQPLPRAVLNFERRGVDEKELFLVAYGDMLFDSPEIFGAPANGLGLACSSCHNRGDVNRALFVPGLSRRAGGIDVDNGFFNPRGNDGRFDPLDTPSLRGIRFTAPYGRDGRMASLREFVRNVIVGEFGGAEPTPLMLDALLAYMNEFDFLPAPLLARDGSLNEGASAAARRGEAIFNRPFPGMAGRSCATCHVPDGNFVDGRRHDIGSVAPSSPHARDGALDTPTLLGIRYTAPYFHDGSLPTLPAVVAWFDRRYRLDLDAGERADLAAYLEAVGTGEAPFEAFDGTNTRFRLGFEEASTFLSTLDTLIPARDRRHALLLLATVGRDLRTDAAAMGNIAALGRVSELAAKIDAISDAVSAEDWAAAERLWEGYKKAEARHAAELY